jgi:nucleotide-binding universal stress UspA family protein
MAVKPAKMPEYSMNILLAIDPSVSSDIAVTEVASRPWPQGTKVCVLTVIEPSAFIGLASLVETATQAARALVKNAAERLETHGIDVSTAVIHGNARTEVVNYAENWAADFVIVGSHGQSALTRFLMGSVAQAVLRHAPCSVEIVRPRIPDKARVTPGAMKVLIATDGSDCSGSAVRSVADRPWPEGSEFNVVSAVHVVVPPDGWYVDPVLVNRLWADADEQAQQAIAAARLILVRPGLNVTTTIHRGDPRAILVDQAKEWNADLIVLGSHGRRGLTRMLLGSVSEAVAMHSRCSVEVIRERS